MKKLNLTIIMPVFYKKNNIPTNNTLKLKILNLIQSNYLIIKKYNSFL